MTGSEVVGSGAKVGYLTVVSRWKDVISNGDAFVKSVCQRVTKKYTHDWYPGQDLLIPSRGISPC